MGIPKTVRNTAISACIILVLLVLAGVGYTYFMGPEASSGQLTAPAPAAVQRLPKPAKDPPNAPVGASVQSLLSPVAAGSNTSMTIRTRADASCKIVVEYGAVKSRDSGLTTKIADDYGLVSWTWTVDANVPPGKYPAGVTCVRGEKSAYVRGDLVVEKPGEKPAAP